MKYLILPALLCFFSLNVNGQSTSVYQNNGSFKSYSDFQSERANNEYQRRQNLGGVKYSTGSDPEIKVKTEKIVSQPYYGTAREGFKIYSPSNSDKWGFADKNDRIVIPATYDATFDFNGGVAKVRIGENFGFINTMNEIVIPIKYSAIDHELTDFTRVSQGINWYGYIDRKNNVVIKAKYKTLSRFSESGYAVANETSEPNKFGSIDKHENVIIPFTYEQILWDGDLAIVKMNGRWGMLNHYGETIIPIMYTNQIEWNDQGIAYVSNGSRWGAIDRTGKIIIPFNYCDLGEVNGDIIMCVDGKYGMMDIKENILIKPTFEEFFYFNEGVASVKMQGKYGLLNKVGRIILSPRYDKPIVFENGLATIIEAGKYSLTNTKGVLLIYEFFDKPISFENGMGTIVLNGKYGLINDKGKKIAQPIYDQPITFYKDDEVADIVLNGKYGCIYKTGYVILKPIYEKQAISFFAINKNYTVVKLNDKYGYVDITGKAITEIMFDYADEFSNSDVGLVRLKKKQGLVNTKGELVILEEPLDYSIKFVQFWNGEYCPVQGRNGKHGVLNKKGKLVIPFKYQEEVFFGDGLAAVSNRKKNDYEEGKWGFINEKGELVIDYQFDEVYSYFKKGFCQVELNREMFYIDKTGKRIKE